MARLIWTDPALRDLEAIADYIALDKPTAAARFIRRVFAKVELLLTSNENRSIYGDAIYWDG